MKRTYSILLLVLFVAAAILGAWKFWLMYKEWKYTQEELTSLQILYYKTAQELTESHSQINALNEKITVLKGSNEQLNKEKQGLEQRITNLEQEKQAIEAKFHSLTELKGAIRQVKIEMRQQKIQLELIRKEQQRELDAQELAMGNRGFIVKSGQSTYKPTIRIEVKPGN
jgi:chromosome segregation ATPase